ncbi:ABC transporter ATP-binding protein [Candidatus Amarolinea dominans]|uniref:ABC transporter ATP-binding protein n=1 Tax=Candidatus Amarolinea dominans TaxID=3140696 RepID=UPI001D4862F8|nr:ABC transporter ATP-binding protein [Anaerolineae bacterium]
MPDRTQTLLRVADVSRQFGGLTALDHVSFDVMAGAICGLIGPNGAGKTTLINIISGLTPVNSGRITFDGAVISGLPAHDIARCGIGRTFQNIRLFGDLSVLENVMVGHHLRQPGAIIETLLRLPRSRRAEQATQAAALGLLRRLRVEHLAAAAAGALSYGDQRRVEMARALALEPRLLLLDEPAAGMIAAETEQLAHLLLELRAAGLTLLVIEHHMDLIMSICDQVVVLNFGRTIAAGTPDQVRHDPRVIEAYLGNEGNEGQ